VKTSIRRARPADAAGLTRIAHAAKRYWGYPDELIRLWKAELTVTPELVASEPVYCAVRGREIAGFYALSGRQDTRGLEHMWVDPRYIGSGIGKQLFTHLLERLRATGATRLEIASDPNAEGFYRRMGARRIGSVPSAPPGRHLPLLLIRFRSTGEAGARKRRRRADSTSPRSVAGRGPLAMRAAGTGT
jgi:GNAT superfamily N-acetyltransferase